MELDIGGNKNDTFKFQLHMLFEQYKSLCINEKGVQIFHYKPLDEENAKVFGGNEPTVLKSLNAIMSSIPLFSNGSELKIYKLHRKSKLLFVGDPDTIVRILLPIGSDGLSQSEVCHGASTGRGLKVTKIVKGGQAIALQPQQSLEIVSDEKAKVFIKGKGRSDFIKEKNFEQYIVFFEMKMDQKLIKNMKETFLKSGGDMNAMLKSKLGDLDALGVNTNDLTNEMKKFTSLQEEDITPEQTKEDEEFMA